MTFLAALMFSFNFVGIWTITDGVKARPTNWRNIAIGAILCIIGYLLSIGPISLGR